MTSAERAKKTREQNRAAKAMYEETIRPAHEKTDAILNALLAKHTVRLKFVGPFRLKGGVTGGRLIKSTFGGLTYTVLVDGYKNPRGYASSFWAASPESEGGR